MYGERPTDVAGGSFNNTKRQAFTSRDIRFTTRGDLLYATVLGRPEGLVTIQSLATTIKLYVGDIGDVRCVGANDPVSWSRDETGLHVTVPSDLPGEHAVVLKISRKQTGERRV